MRTARGALLVLAVLVLPGSPGARAAAQDIADGYVSALGDVFPALPRPGSDAREPATEFRGRVFLERRLEAGEHVRLHISGYLDVLLADRPCASAGVCDLATDLAAGPQDVYAELAWTRADVRVGYSRIVWGRLDELQPTDVVNPLDVSRFVFEGRAEARLAVPLVRTRLFLPGNTTLEGIAVPAFRRGRFDQLEEATSPFNPLPSPVLCIGSDCVVLPVAREMPSVTWHNLQGGGRVSTTTGRVDWTVCVWRGFEPLPLVTTRTAAPGAASLHQVYPRFTMVGADFETVRGAWGLRGEVAFFPDDTVQTPLLTAVPAQSVEGGLGVDRRAGDYRVSGNVLLRRRWTDHVPDPATIDRTDLNLIGSIDRTFRRETRRLQVFGVLDPTEGTTFLRAILTFNLRDNLAFDASAGAFVGTGRDNLGALTDQDFILLRLKRYF